MRFLTLVCARAVAAPWFATAARAAPMRFLTLVCARAVAAPWFDASERNARVVAQLRASEPAREPNVETHFLSCAAWSGRVPKLVNKISAKFGSGPTEQTCCRNFSEIRPSGRLGVRGAGGGRGVETTAGSPA